MKLYTNMVGIMKICVWGASDTMILSVDGLRRDLFLCSLF
jgi:hypothetical protein